MPFRAGQFFNMRVPNAKPRPERSHSVFSDPGRRGGFDLCIKLLKGGAASEMLRVASVGDPYSFRGPMGVFTMADDEQPVTMVATGTGVVPYHSMLCEYARLFARHQATPRRYRLYFGVRDEEDLFLVAQLASWQDELPDFAYRVCLSRPSDAWTGFRGRVTVALAADLPPERIPTGHFYLCGNSPMIEETKSLLKARGVDHSRIHSEKYY